MAMKKTIHHNCILRKLQSRAAFTLAEVLVAILIMLMVSGIMAAGIPAAKNAYYEVITASNAEILLSTTVTALRNELGTAGLVQVKNNEVTFIDSTSHTGSRISRSTGSEHFSDGKAIHSGMIMLQEYADVTLDVGDGEELTAGDDVRTSTLVPEKAIEEDQYVTYESVTAGEDWVTFNGLSVRSTKDNRRIAPRNAQPISIRVFSGVK